MIFYCDLQGNLKAFQNETVYQGSNNVTTIYVVAPFSRPVVSFLFCMATAVFVVACVVLTLLAVALFISGQTLGGIVFLVLAFLISPYGIPAIAEWLVDKLHNLNFALRGFITG